MKYFNPIYFLKIIASIFVELKNFRFYWKKMKDLEISGELKRRGLRIDAIKRLYFVKNIEPEALLYGETEQGGVEQFEKKLVAESLKIHNEIFVRDNSIELVKVKFERIKTPDYYAYLVWIGFKFQKIKFSNFAYLITYCIFAAYLIRAAIRFYPVVANWIIHITHFLS